MHEPIPYKHCKPYKHIKRLAGWRRKLPEQDKRLLSAYCGPYIWAVDLVGAHLTTPTRICYEANADRVWQARTRGMFGPARVYYGVGDATPKDLTARPDLIDKFVRAWYANCKKRTVLPFEGAARGKKKSR